MNNDILILDDLHRTYHTGGKDLEVLKGVNLTLSAGEWCCIFGASGSGKTTLLNLIGLLEKPDQGKIILCGQDTAGLSRSQIARFRAKNIGFVFQSYHLLPELNILENVALAGMIAGMSRRDAFSKAENLIGKVGLEPRKLHRPTELSGGEQQRAAIARALINDPPLLLTDEPTGNLGPETGTEIL
jgi:ABC-type lipoprotein export system ATPase subunit